MKTNILFIALLLGTLGFTKAQTARLQVIHNSSDAAASQIDVYLNGNLLLDNFAFRTATPIIDIAADVSHTIAVAPSNSMSVSEAIATFPVMFEGGETYIVVANGIVSATGYTPCNTIQSACLCRRT